MPATRCSAALSMTRFALGLTGSVSRSVRATTRAPGLQSAAAPPSRSRYHGVGRLALFGRRGPGGPSEDAVTDVTLDPGALEAGAAYHLLNSLVVPRPIAW